MANKNYAGSLVYRAELRIDRLNDKIDRRTEDGSDRENVDHVWQNNTKNDNGDRCWSF